MMNKEMEELSFKAIKVVIPKELPEIPFQRSLYHYLSQYLSPSSFIDEIVTPYVLDSFGEVELITSDQLLITISAFNDDRLSNSKRILKFLYNIAPKSTKQFRNALKLLVEANIPVNCFESLSAEANESTFFLLRLACLLMPLTPAHPQVLPNLISKLIQLFLQTDLAEDENVILYSIAILLLKLYSTNISEDLSISIEFCPPRSGSVEDPSNMAFIMLGSIPGAFTRLEEIAKKSTNNRTRLFCRGSCESNSLFIPARNLLMLTAEHLSPFVERLSKTLDFSSDPTRSLLSWSILDLLSANFEASCPLDSEIFSMVVQKFPVLDKIIPKIEEYLAKINVTSLTEVTAFSLPVIPELIRIGSSFALKFMQRQISYVPWRITKYLSADSVINLAAIISQQKDDIICPVLANFIGSVGLWVFDSNAKVPSHILGSIYMYQTEYDAFPLWPVDPVLSAISPNLDPTRRVVIDEQKLFGLACQHCLMEGIAPIPFNV